jgi:hypothetical protein
MDLSLEEAMDMSRDRQILELESTSSKYIIIIIICKI